VEDCYAALQWLTEKAHDLGVDPERIILCGLSAGGGLAAATALMARDRGTPTYAGQLLFCPMLDDRNDTTSTHQLQQVGIWKRPDNRIGWLALLGEEPGGPDVSPYAAPARAASLAGLPPTFLDVGTVETFRDEVVAYASKIWADGGDAELHVWPGGTHAHEFIAPHGAIGSRAWDAKLAWVSRIIGG
jgi:acetyl esterase/lipase